MATQAPYAGFEMTLTAGGVTIAKARDADVDMSATEIDTTTRDDNGWKTFIQGLKEWGLSVGQIWVPTNAGLIVLRDAYFSGSTLAIQLRDPDNHGYNGNVIVSGLTKGEPLDDVCTLDVTMKGTGALVIRDGVS
jgi:predicted secreted protein